MRNISRRSLVEGSLAVIVTGAAISRTAFAQSSEPIMLGVSGPLTGPNAQYGAQWKQGFDLALDEIQAAGGINGRKLAYTFEDSQSDPRQSVAIAQKFVSDPKIVMELGDFSSPASMAASPIYQRAGLVQFGFTNSHPDFTKGGDFMWSTSVSQADEQPLLARYAVSHLGLKKLAILHLNTDWGRTSRDHFATAAKEYGAEVVISEGYIPDERDFRSTLVRARDALLHERARVADECLADPLPTRRLVDDHVFDPALHAGRDAVEDERQRAEHAAVVAAREEQRLVRYDVLQLLERRRRARLGELRQQRTDRRDELVARLGDALDLHRRSRDMRRSLSTRPSVWHSGQ